MMYTTAILQHISLRNEQVVNEHAVAAKGQLFKIL